MSNKKNPQQKVQQAFQVLKDKGFMIEQISENKFKVFDNGKFGFAEEEPPFFVDEEDLLEIHEMYCS